MSSSKFSWVWSLQDGHLTEEEYVQWACSVPNFASLLIKVLFEVCHVRFGLRPQSLANEAKVIRGYMRRFKKRGRCHGDVVYLVTASWFNRWKLHTNYEVCVYTHVQCTCVGLR